MAIAVKVLRRAAGRSDKSEVKELENEISLMQTLDHPNIVRYLGCEVAPDHLFIFQEWVPCGSLASVITDYGALKEVRQLSVCLLCRTPSVRPSRNSHNPIPPSQFP